MTAWIYQQVWLVFEMLSLIINQDLGESIKTKLKISDVQISRAKHRNIKSIVVYINIGKILFEVSTMLIYIL